MKKIFFLFVTLCVTHIVFSQINVDNAGNVGIGAAPNSKAKLLLNNTKAATDTLSGLHSTVENTNLNLTKPVYGLYSNNNNASMSNSLYGAYFKNTQTSSLGGKGLPLYGIYLDNTNYPSSGYGFTYGTYTNNITTGYSNTVYGHYVNNTNNGVTGNIYGFYANNISKNTYSGTMYGIYLKNDRSIGGYGDVYGIYSENTSKANGAIYGAYLSATSTSNRIYGIYSTVSGGDANNRYAGYFTGGKVVIMNGNVGIGKEPTAGLLDVAGNIAVNGSVVITSDERLKTAIRPLSDEKDKLYLLQGKSYKKTLPPAEVKEDSLSATGKIEKKKEIIEFSEYGYLAQELKEVFPDLVSQDSAGYYAVNYIGLIPVIVEALKDQRLEIENKQNQIEKQQSQIEKQQVQIDEQREQIKQLVKLIGIKSIDKKAFEENGIESIPLLLQNTPNPFNQTTEIGYYIPQTVGSANIYIYDVNGVQQRNISIAERGQGITVLQATALQAGIYFYTLICDGKPVDTKQMILTR